MKYILIALFTVILGLSIFLKYQNSKIDELETENSDLSITIEVLSHSLELEKSRTNILENMYNSTKQNLQELENNVSKITQKQIIVKNCKIKMYDLNKSVGIPKYLGNIGK